MSKQPRQPKPEVIDPMLYLEIETAFNVWWQDNKPAYPYAGVTDRTEVYIIFRDGYRAAKDVK